MMANIIHNNREITPETKFKILALSRIDGLGPIKFQKLIKRYNNIENVFHADYKDLCSLIPSGIAKEISSKKCISDTVKYLKMVKKNKVSFLTIFDNNYPDLLKEIYDPPIILYYKGDFKSDDFNSCFSVVGTRKCTNYGERVTEDLVKGLVECSFTIVSGMAFGIDKIVHESAMSAGGRTIAVLSGRVDRSSPLTNYRTYEKVLGKGFVISENHLDVKVTSGLFPLRNRIISGLSRGTLVIEAGKKSGALITARSALEQDREVFAVPSDIYSESGVGANRLIQKGGAKLVERVDDILEEFNIKMEGKKVERIKPDNSEEKAVLDFLKKGASTIDEISQGINMDISELSEVMSIMEIEKKLAKDKGDRYFILV